MKKCQSLLLAALVMLVGCSEINDRLDVLEGRVDAIEKTQIATISQQITSINNSILLLNSTDKELGAYITALEAEAENLQTQITATNAKIDEVKTEVLSTISNEKASILAELEELRNATIARLEEINTTIAELQAADGDMSVRIAALEAEAAQLKANLAETNTKIDTLKSELTETISTEKAKILAELEAFKAIVNSELDAIKGVLETLKAKDGELDDKIATLQEYVDNELKDTEDWATATFATLEHYNEVVTTIAAIEGTIEGINESMTALETRINEKIAKDIEAASTTLSVDLQNAVKEVTDSYTTAIATAKQEITEAYTAAIKTAIATSEASMEEWVNEQLTGYYTIAEIEAKISVLETTISEGDTALQKEIDALETSLTKQKNEITEAYQSAIAEAITANNGVIDDKIAAEIKTVNDKIADLERRLDDLESRITVLEENYANQQEQVTALVNRIQSVSYIPKYSDGKATIDTEKKIGVFDFQISPKDAVEELDMVWVSALSMQAVHTQTRAVSFIEMPITYFEADVNNGTFFIEIDATNLGDNFFSGEIEASAALCISDGNNNRTSEYINLTLGEVESSMPPANQIWYTSTDDNVVIPYETNAFGANIVLNTYENGKGVIKFDAPVTSIGDDAFYFCNSLTSVIIPDGVTSIGDNAFYLCGCLTSVIIPNSVTSIGDNTFGHCSSLKNITIPNSVTSIGVSPFGCCDSLTAFYGKFASTDGRILIIDGALKSFAPAGLTEYTISDSVTSIGDYAFSQCNSLTSVTIPDSVTSIRDRAFCNSSRLTSVTIGSSVTSIGESAFFGCSGLSAFYGKFASADNRCLIIDGELKWFAQAGLTEYTIPDSVTSIGESAFYGCEDLTSVTIPNSVTSIGDNAFFSCDSLTSVTIPDSVTWIQWGAFSGCGSLTEVYCKPTTPPTLSLYVFHNNPSDFKIYVPRNSVDAYKSSYWKDYVANIEGYDF